MPDQTILGYLDQKYKYSQSIQTIQEEEDWNLILSDPIQNKINNFLHSVVNFNDTIYTN